MKKQSIEPAFRAIFEHTDAIVFIKDLRGRYLYSNRRHRELFNRGQIVHGQIDTDLFPLKQARAMRANDRAVMRRGRAVELEETAPLPDGVHTYVVSKFPMKDERGKLAGICGLATDITHLKNVERALRENELRYRLFVESVTDTSVVLLDPQGRISSWDAAAERLRGFTMHDVMGKFYSILFRREDVRAGLPRKLLLRMEKMGSFDYEGWRRRKDGSLYWAKLTLKVLRDAKGRVAGYASVAKDITDKRRLEREMETARYLIAGEENERRRVARELHDGINQVLGVAKQRLFTVQNKLSERDRGAASEVAAATDIIGRAITEVRQIARNLRPTVLDDLGLRAALRSLCDDLKRSAGLAGSVRTTGALDRLPGPIEATVYRVVQEAASNAVKHARATRFDVSLHAGDGLVHLQVRDNGRGFNKSSSKGSGLVNIRERVSYWGGRFGVESRRGRGTLINVALPTVPRKELA